MVPVAERRRKGVNVGWAIIGVSANPWVHHLQI
jgi:hypothetical protein